MDPDVDRFTAKFTEAVCWRWQYHGVEIAKHPCDLMVYQAIIWEHRPNVIIECGTFRGGSALFLAEQLDAAVRDGFVVTIDVNADYPHRYHPRLTYLQHSSEDPKALQKVKEMSAATAPEPRVMVILDSDHHKEHVLAELELWAPLVTPGQYLIVEDTCINGHPVLSGWGPGPFEAVAEWLPRHPEFEVDRSRERFLSTFNPDGYLRRKK